MEALVEFHYVAQEPDELTIRKGDIIKDVKIMSGGWWEGTLRDQRGMFPDNFVKVLETSASGVKNEVSVEAKKESVILRNGSVVVNNSALTSSTCSNINNTNGSITTTTTTTTTTISSSNSSSSNNSASSNNNNNNNNNSNISNNSSSSKWCKVLFSYDPCNEDELGLIPNDMIEYLGQVEEGWWTGRLRGRVGVFPSNFVSPPTTAEDTKELCRVLFAYEAANEDELTLTEGEIVTLISRDAPDKGWWKGELRGKIGLFPDNFVQVLSIKESSYQDDGSKAAVVRPLELNRGLKSTTTTTASNLKQWNTGKKGEKAYARKSLDTRTTTTTTTDKKSISPVLASSSLSEKKSAVNSSPISPGIKRLIKSEDISSILPTDTAAAAAAAADHHNESIDEELDGVEREEDTPLLHLTASRVKAPRRRLPSSHHRQTSTEIGTVTTTNGAIDTVDQSKNDDNETISGKNRQPVAPWIEELKFNQMEKKKILSTDKIDKKDKNQLHESSPPPVHTADTLEQFQFQDSNQDSQRLIKDKDSTSCTYQRTNLHAVGPVSPTSGTPPAYVPYRLYSQLLDRVTTLEERQTVLQRMVVQLSEQVGPLLTNSSIIGGGGGNNKS